MFNALRAKILDGAFASRFPSERSLMRQFGVTRTGIRTILAKLEAQHIITRHRGSGTFLVERARDRASGIFGIIIPNAKSPFYAAMIDGISKSVKNSGGGGRIFAAYLRSRYGRGSSSRRRASCRTLPCRARNRRILPSASIQARTTDDIKDSFAIPRSENPRHPD